MKEIIIGRCLSGKSRNYVAPTIKNYTGSIIYITTLDDREYLGIEKILERVDLTDNRFLFSSDTKVFVKVNPDNPETIASTQRALKQYLDKENLLIVIDEASYVLNENLLNFIVYSASLKADIMIVLQSDTLINNKLQGLSQLEKFEAQNILDKYWNVINVPNEIIGFS